MIFVFGICFLFLIFLMLKRVRKFQKEKIFEMVEKDPSQDSDIEV